MLRFELLMNFDQGLIQTKESYITLINIGNFLFISILTS